MNNLTESSLEFLTFAMDVNLVKYGNLFMLVKLKTFLSVWKI